MVEVDRQRRQRRPSRSSSSTRRGASASSPSGSRRSFFGKVDDYRGQRQMTNPVVDVIVGARGEERDASRDRARRRDLPGVGQGRADQLGDRAGSSRSRCAAPARSLDPLAADRCATSWTSSTAPPSTGGIHLPDDLRRHRPGAAAARLRRVLAPPAAARAAPAAPRGVLGGHPPPHRRRRPRRRARGARRRPSSLVRRFLVGHRFALTGAQRRVLGEIAPRPGVAAARCTGSSRATSVRARPSWRSTALLAAVDGGRQGALMAPTEVLAEQHLASLRTRPRGPHASPTTRVLGGERPLVVAAAHRTRAREASAAPCSSGLARRVGRHRGRHARAA